MSLQSPNPKQQPLRQQISSNKLIQNILLYTNLKPLHLKAINNRFQAELQTRQNIQTYRTSYNNTKQMIEFDSALIIKILLAVAFFMQVMIFGRFISSCSCFKQGNIMSYAMTFSGSLFMSIAFLDIIPEAISNFDVYFTQNPDISAIKSKSGMHQTNLPLTMIIASVTFLIIMFIDKILIGHSHDHQYEVSFINQPRRSQKSIRNDDANMKNIQMQQVGQNGSVIKKSSDSNVSFKQLVNQLPTIYSTSWNEHTCFFLNFSCRNSKNSTWNFKFGVGNFDSQMGLRFNFGFNIQKRRVQDTMVNGMILVQASINVLGLFTGIILRNQGVFIMAFFMSISAGTFLYISTAEVLLQQVQKMNKRKFIAMILAVTFVSALVLFQKYEEANAEASQTLL